MRPVSQESTSVPLDDVRRIAAFRAALRTFVARIEVAARGAGLTPRWYLALLFVKGAVDGSERASFGELAGRLKLNTNTVTELVGRMEAAGLLFREPSDVDRRVVYLRLSDEGERRLQATLLASEQDRRRLAVELRDLVDLYDPVEPA
jgi:DNA-binding MarR family transcriptional regulator